MSQSADTAPGVDTASAARDFLPHQHTPCMARLDAQRSWHKTLAVRAGSRFVGVRVDGEEGAIAVERLFWGSRVSRLDGVAPPNFSLELADGKKAAGPRGLNLLYRDHQVIARRRTAGEIMLDLGAIIDATSLDQESACLALRASALVAESADGPFAVLLPAAWHRTLMLRRTWLESRGLALLAADVHLVQGEGLMRVPVGAPEHDTGGWLPLLRWGVRVDGEGQRELRRAKGIQLAFPAVVNLAVLGPDETLRRLEGLTRTTQVVALPGQAASGWPGTAARLAHV